MWLTYLRFESGNDTRIALVRSVNRAEVDEVLRVAKRLFAPQLTEYATFYSGRAIYPKDVPNFAEGLIFSTGSFLRACGVDPGDVGGSPAPAQPPGSPGAAGPQLPPAAGTAVVQQGAFR